MKEYIFDHTWFSACFFHYAQNLIRALARLHLKSEYETNKVFAHAIRRFAALAFLPVSEIVEAFLDITMCLDDCEEDNCESGCIAKEVPDSFCQYFEANYIGIIQGRGKNQKRRTPRFPPSFWSVHDRLRANLPRYGH